MADTYYLKLSDPTKSTIQVSPGTIDGPGEIARSTDLALPGQGKIHYGDHLDENLLHLLENFAHPESAPGEPDPVILAAPLEGQLWYNSSNSMIYVYNGAEWATVGGGSGGAGITQVDADTRYLKLDGTNTMGAVLNMGANKISFLDEPGVATDAATKNYVDVAIAAVSGNTGITQAAADARYLKLDGTNSMSGSLTLLASSDLNLKGNTISGAGSLSQRYNSPTSRFFFDSKDTFYIHGYSNIVTDEVNGFALHVDDITGTDVSYEFVISSRDSAHSSGKRWLSWLYTLGQLPEFDIANTDITFTFGTFISTATEVRFGGTILQNVGDPAVDTDAATKGYVEGRILDIVGGTGLDETTANGLYLRLDGTGTMTGNVNVGGGKVVNLTGTLASFNANDAVSKAYVDDAISGVSGGTGISEGDADARYVKKGSTVLPPSGSPFGNHAVYIGWTGTKLKSIVDVTDIGSFVMRADADNRIINIGTPTGATDGANKGYVDAATFSAITNLTVSGATVDIGSTTSKTVRLSGGSGTTITSFGSSGTEPSGTMKAVFFDSVYTLVHSVNLILQNRGVNIVTHPGDTGMFEKIGAGIWKCVSYTYANGLPELNGGVNGYQKFPGGFMMQWGLTTPATTQAAKTVTFPIPFPNYCLNVQITVRNTTGSGAASYDTWGQVIGLNSSFFTMIFQNSDGDPFSSVDAHWFAIGY